MKRELESIANLSYVDAVYMYDLPHTSVPLVFLKEDKLPELSFSKLALQGIIVLTREDLKHGQDAFALTYMHMKSRTSLFAGHDVLAALAPHQSHIIDHMELLLRGLLIDLREHLVLKRKLHKVTNNQLLLSLDRILCGGGYVLDLGAHPMDMLSLAEKIDLHWGLQLRNTVVLLRAEIGVIQLKIVYDNLLALLQKIDTLH